MLDCSISEIGFVDETVAEINRVLETVYGDIKRFEGQDIIGQLRRQFSPGKMLRTRLGMVLAQQDGASTDALIKACAATELIHAATLFHDDVIDGAVVRRRHPTLWREVGSTGAILVGDLFFSTAVQLVVESGDVASVASFVSKVREVCATEMIHEMLMKDKAIDVDTCIRVARGKTGPLFAFVAECCGGDSSNRRKELCEVGYLLGTAYQLADDLLDVVGDEAAIGKTLGTDSKKKKYTLAQCDQISESHIRKQIETLCRDALGRLWSWPELILEVRRYITADLLPFWEMDLVNDVEHAATYEVG